MKIGFLKILEPQKLAFLDFSGNMQYISAGNVRTNNKVSLILMDYTKKARLKIYAESEVLSLLENPDLVGKLE